MKVCAGRKTAYLNGMSYEECKKLAEEITKKLIPEILNDGEMMWSELVKRANHDELIYKLVLSIYVEMDLISAIQNHQ